MSHPQPRFSVIVDGKDISAVVDARLRSLTLTDSRGFEADQLDLVLNDSDGLLDLPPRGAKIRIAIGWETTGLVDKGSYIVDEVEHSGTPDQLSIRARSADLRAGMTTQRERSWHDTTLGQIVTAIAMENELRPLIEAGLEAVAIEHIDQTNESDANLLTRLAEANDAIATVKDGRLLFIPAGRARSASGKELPRVVITRADGDQHRFALADRETWTGVRATYYDTRTNRKEEVIVSKRLEESDVPSGEISQSVENIKTLRHVYSSRATAERAARAEWNRLQRGVATFALTQALGDPTLFPEIPVTLTGWKPDIDGTDWIVTRVTHNITDSGYTAGVELEIRNSDIPG